MKDYPELTPYQFASDNPIANIDLDGLESTYSYDNKKLLGLGPLANMNKVQHDEFIKNQTTLATPGCLSPNSIAKTKSTQIKSKSPIITPNSSVPEGPTLYNAVGASLNFGGEVKVFNTGTLAAKTSAEFYKDRAAGTFETTEGLELSNNMHANWNRFVAGNLSLGFSVKGGGSLPDRDSEFKYGYKLTLSNFSVGVGFLSVNKKVTWDVESGAVSADYSLKLGLGTLGIESGQLKYMPYLSNRNLSYSKGGVFYQKGSTRVKYSQFKRKNFSMSGN